jgi:hypothetical protein
MMQMSDTAWVDRGLGWRMSASAALLCSVTIASAAYTLVPGVGYVVILAMALLICLDSRVAALAAPGIPGWPLAGFALFNALFMLRGVGTGLDLRTLLVHVLSLGTFVLSFTAWRCVLASTDKTKTSAAIVAIAAFSIVAILLAGQVAEMTGLIDRRNLAVDQGDSTYVFRPGGLLNPNMTAAIAVIAVFTAGESRVGKLRGVDYATILLTIIVVLLTQSRTLIATLLAYLFILGLRNPMILVTAPILLMASVFALLGDSATEAMLAIIERVAGRFDGSLASDVSNAERLKVMTEAFSAADQAPWFGSGYLFLVKIAGVSSHNQFVDLMVNFGVFGLAAGIAGMALLYVPVSPAMFAFCMLPTLMFSHNFFDSAPFQASLGMALAVDRYRRAR